MNVRAAPSNSGLGRVRAQVFEQKMGRVQFARPNAAMKHGNKTETEALRVYESQTGQTCLRFGLKAHDRCGGDEGGAF